MVEFAQIVGLEPAYPDLLISGGHWSQTESAGWPLHEFLRQDLPFEAELSQNKIVRLADLPEALAQNPGLANFWPTPR
ncbi:MAG: hypothetical protein M5U34_00820 [Chloroflexi bacterium]|nr:hypothetical protein [Chloroflexota bacterium]